MDTFSKNWAEGYMADEKVCESCIEAIEEEGVPEGDEARIAIELGADIADHRCNQLESDGDIQCACACHPRKRSAKWSGKAKDFTPDVVEETYRKLWSAPAHNYLGRDGKPLVG